MDCEIQYTRKADLPAGYMAVGAGNQVSKGKPAYGQDGVTNKDVGCTGAEFADTMLSETGCGAQTVRVWQNFWIQHFLGLVMVPC